MSSSVRMAVLKRRELAKQVEYEDKKKNKHFNSNETLFTSRTKSTKYRKT